MHSMNTLTEQPARRKKSTSRRKVVARSYGAVRGAAGPSGGLLTGQALLDDMDDYRRQVTSSPAAAQSFLQRLGVLTKGGKTKTLIRG